MLTHQSLVKNSASFFLTTVRNGTIIFTKLQLKTILFAILQLEHNTYYNVPIDTKYLLQYFISNTIIHCNAKVLQYFTMLLQSNASEPRLA